MTRDEILSGYPELARQEFGNLQAEIDRLRAELAAAWEARDDYMRTNGDLRNEIKQNRADNAAKDARIAELEAKLGEMQAAYIMKLSDERSSHELTESLLRGYVGTNAAAIARAEKAEADRKRAEAERDALREALEPFAIACRCNTTGLDPDDLILRVPMTVGHLRKARAALQSCASAPQDNPSQAGRG